MATIARSHNTRAVRRLEKPRPLNRPTVEAEESSSVSFESTPFEGLMSLIDFVTSSIVKENYDDVLAVNINMVCNQLETYGQQLEASNKAQLDKAFYIFRDASRDNRLDHLARLNLLKLIELRDSHWQPGNNFNSFYSANFSPGALENAVKEMTLSSKSLHSSVPPSPILSPGEIIKASGKYGKPAKIPGKNYCKDEVVIRNADSGKVMGIKGRRVHMIEELSETIISFQRVPTGAKERLVQITGPTIENIAHAVHLMDDTIRRNASPIREQPEKDHIGGSSSSLNSSASDESTRLISSSGVKNSLNDTSLNEFKYTVTVGNENIRIISCNFGLAVTAKLVLDEHFANSSNIIDTPEYFSSYNNANSSYTSSVHDIVPSISKNPLLSNETFKASGIPLNVNSDVASSFSLSSNAGLTDLIPGTNVDSSASNQTISVVKPFAAFQSNNVLYSSPNVLGQTVSNSNFISSPTSENSNGISSSPDKKTITSPIEVRDGPIKTFSLNQSLSALLSVNAKKDSPKLKQYSRDKLNLLRTSSLSMELPQNWDRICQEFPSIVKTILDVSPSSVQVLSVSQQNIQCAQLNVQQSLQQSVQHSSQQNVQQNSQLNTQLSLQQNLQQSVLEGVQQSAQQTSQQSIQQSKQQNLPQIVQQSDQRNAQPSSSLSTALEKNDSSSVIVPNSNQ